MNDLTTTISVPTEKPKAGMLSKRPESFRRKYTIFTVSGFKRILILIFFALAFCPTGTEADDEGYLGTVLEIGAANYVVQMDDGNLVDVEWDSGYDDWSRGDRVVLTTESGGGYMYSDSGQTEVDVFPYNPADFGD